MEVFSGNRLYGLVQMLRKFSRLALDSYTNEKRFMTIVAADLNDD